MQGGLASLNLPSTPLTKNPKLIEEWENERANVLRSFYKSLFFLGSEKEAMLDVEYVSKLPVHVEPLIKELIKEEPQSSKAQTRASSSKNAGKSSPNESQSRTRTSYKPLAAVSNIETPSGGEVDDNQSAISSSIDDLTRESVMASWGRHMQWCNKNGKTLMGTLSRIADDAVRGNTPPPTLPTCRCLTSLRPV